VKEECDDGLGADAAPDRACTQACVVTDRLVATDSAVLARRLGDGRHPLACSPAGHAVAFVETPFADAANGDRVAVATFGSAGERKAVARLATNSFEPSPVVAALPDGSYALAFAAVVAAGASLDVQLAHVSSDGASVNLAGLANTTTDFGQHSPDLAWAGQELVVAWEDDSPPVSPSSSGRRICTRRFGADLTPLAASEQCDAVSQYFPSHIVLAAGAPGVLRSWRQDGGSLHQFVVAGSAWSTAIATSPSPTKDDAQALAWVDGTHALLVFTNGDGEQMAAAVSSSGAVAMSPTKLNPTPAPARFAPSLAVTADGVYLAWREPAVLGDGGWDPAYEELWLQKLVWTGSGLDTTTHAPIRLPRETSHRPGDQRTPQLAPCVLAPAGAVLGSWDDLTGTNYSTQSPHGDVVVELIPTPVVRGGGA
jgi:hypothetical protein